MRKRAARRAPTPAFLWAACAIAVAVPRTALAEDPCEGGEAPAPVDGVSAPPPMQPAPAPPPPDAKSPLRSSRMARDIVVEVPNERTTPNKIGLAGLAAGGLLVGAIGLYFHLDARDAVDAVEADRFTGEAWTAEKVELVDRADRSSTRAGIAYGIGGAILIGAIVGFIVTDPKSQTSVIRTSQITPTAGGAIVGTGWSF